MAACLQCGKKTENDYLQFKGGVSRALCQACQKEEYVERTIDQEKDQENKEG